jgi:hypothetical protein
MGSVGDDVRPLLSGVRSPVLIVHGGSGAIPTEAMHAWTAALPDARLMVIPDAGHYLHVDRPDVFFPAALEFLRGSWPAGARDDALVSADDIAVLTARGKLNAARGRDHARAICRRARGKVHTRAGAPETLRAVCLFRSGNLHERRGGGASLCSLPRTG